MEIEFTNKFLRNQKKFPIEIKYRIIYAVKEIAVDPHTGIPLTGPLKGIWKKVVGKYRIEYVIDYENQTGK